MSNCIYPLSSIISPGFYGLGVVLFTVLFLIFVKVRLAITNSFFKVGSLLMVTGACLNALERVTRGGCVLDYLSFFGMVYFNVYDIMICVGVVLVIAELLKDAIWMPR